MTPLDQKDLQTGIKKYEDRIERKLEEFASQSAEESRPIAHGFVATDAEHAGLHNVLLGNVEEACQWFETAADQYKISAIKRPDWSESSSELKNIPADLTKALQMAIISGNQSLVADIARATLAVDRAYPYEVEHTGEKVTVEIDADRYHHVRALASLALGDDTRAEEHLDALRAALDDIAEPGDRQARFAADVLSHHKADMQGAVPEIDTEAICVGATAFGCLARQRGLPVTLDSEFIPTALVDAVS